MGFLSRFKGVKDEREVGIERLTRMPEWDYILEMLLIRKFECQTTFHTMNAEDKERAATKVKLIDSILEEIELAGGRIVYDMEDKKPEPEESVITPLRHFNVPGFELVETEKEKNA